MTDGLGQILQALGDRGLRRSGDGWAARCPAHEDKSPSLSIREDPHNGTVLLKCHAGCEVKAVMEALGLPMSTLFPEQTTGTPNANSSQRPKEQIEAIYDYKDQSGKLLFQVVKNRVPGSPDKRFFQRRPDGKDGWINDVKGVKPVLYRLPELLASPRDRVVYTPEGEKDVDAIMASSEVATTNPGGADKWRKEYAEALRGRWGVVLPDNDPIGRKHATKVAESLVGVATSIKMVDLGKLFPELPEKGDISAWLAADHTIAELRAIGAATPEWTPDQTSAATETPRPSLCRQLSTVKPARANWIWFGRLAIGELVLITGAPGTGKGLLVCYIVACYTTGRPLYGDHDSRPPGNVLYISMEDADDTALVPRLMATGADTTRVFSWTMDSGVPSLPESTDKIVSVIDEHQVGLLVIDPAPTLLTERFTANSDADVRRAYTPLAKACRKRGCALLLVRHINKRAGGDAMSRGGGSIGWTGMARTELMLGRKPQPPAKGEETDAAPATDGAEAEIILAIVKSNLGKLPVSLRASIVDAAGSAKIQFLGETTTTADELVEQDRPRKGDAMEAAIALLRRSLADGEWHREREIRHEADTNKISYGTLKRAKKVLEVQSRERSREWWWCIPRQVRMPGVSGADERLKPGPDGRKQGEGESEPLTSNTNNNLQSQNITGSESTAGAPLTNATPTETAPEPLTSPVGAPLTTAEPGCVPLASAAPPVPAPLNQPPLVDPPAALPAPEAEPRTEPEREDLV
jgi:putative DNA primase/helicase